MLKKKLHQQVLAALSTFTLHKIFVVASQNTNVEYEIINTNMEYEIINTNMEYEIIKPAPINNRLNVVVRSPTPFGLGQNGC